MRKEIRTCNELCIYDFTIFITPYSDTYYVRNINQCQKDILLAVLFEETNNKIFIQRRRTRLSWMTRVLPQHTVAMENRLLLLMFDIDVS